MPTLEDYVQQIAALTAYNEAMREPMRKLRAEAKMPAEGEGAVVDRVLEILSSARNACIFKDGWIDSARGECAAAVARAESAEAHVARLEAATKAFLERSERALQRAESAEAKLACDSYVTSPDVAECGNCGGTLTMHSGRGLVGAMLAQVNALEVKHAAAAAEVERLRLALAGEYARGVEDAAAKFDVDATAAKNRIAVLVRGLPVRTWRDEFGHSQSGVDHPPEVRVQQKAQERAESAARRIRALLAATVAACGRCVCGGTAFSAGSDRASRCMECGACKAVR